MSCCMEQCTTQYANVCSPRSCITLGPGAQAAVPDPARPRENGQMALQAEKLGNGGAAGAAREKNEEIAASQALPGARTCKHITVGSGLVGRVRRGEGGTPPPGGRRPPPPPTPTPLAGGTPPSQERYLNTDPLWFLDPGEHCWSAGLGLLA
eukprot:gene22205-biopygen4205